MRWIKLEEGQKNTPVLKNIVYALGLVWKADKRLLIGYMVENIFEFIVKSFIKNILFLKVLLQVLTDVGDYKTYAKYVVMFFVVSALGEIASWYGHGMEKVATKKVLKYINNMIFEKANSLDISCYEDPAFYDKYQRATLVVSGGYFDLICYAVSLIVGGIVALVCVITTVTAINPVYLLFLLPVFIVFVIEIFKSKYIYKRDIEMTKSNRIKAYIQRTVFLKEFSKDIRTSNIFAVLMSRFEAAIKANIMILKKYGWGLFLYSCVSSLCGEFIPLIGTYAYAGYEFVKGEGMTVSGFSVVLSSIESVRGCMMDITNSFDQLSLMAFYFQNLKDFFSFDSKVKSGSKKANELETLEFKNVTFKYPSANKNSLENVSFKINKGETLALVGENGAGKSTLVKLMLRFYDPDSGEVLYNGVNIKEYDIESYRNVFATVFQDYKNFAVSVNENVICRECDENDKKLAEKALRESGVWDKINTLNDKGDTVLTREFDENGAGLSGGENQKLSTARLFARDFQLAVLDEPSSALDPIAEYNMYKSLMEVTNRKTAVYISHRLSSATLSDRIVVLSGGTVIESGTHDELMQLSGEYARMFTLQASSYNKSGENDEKRE